VIILGTRQRHTALLRTRCDAYVAKPFSTDLLFDVIDRMFDPERPSVATAV
jgi:hypothetical protein